MPTSALLSELQQLQRLLVPHSEEQPLPLQPPYAAGADSDAEGAADEALSAARLASQEQLGRLQHEAGRLRQRLQSKAEECEQLRAEARRQRQEAALAAERLQAQLLAHKAEEQGLSGLALSLREENEALQRQLAAATAQAQQNEQVTTQSVQQLSAAARQWRKQHEEAMRQLVAEQEAGAAARAELRAVRERLQCVEADLQAERREHQRAAAKCSALEGAFGAHGKQSAANEALVGELRRRLATERNWRKATQAWLRAELHTKDELERLLVNVGTSVRLGRPQQELAETAAGGQATPLQGCRAAAAAQGTQPATTEPGTAGQNAQAPTTAAGAAKQGLQQPAPAAAAAGQVPALPVPIGQPLAGQADVPPGPCSPAVVPEAAASEQHLQLGRAAAPAPDADWRSTFEATIRAFEERYDKLERELAQVKEHTTAGASPGRAG